MAKFLVFYKVGNSQNYGRHTFDDIYDNAEEIGRLLGKLNDDELKCYNLSCDLPFFVEVYNDEELDGGWWSFVYESD